MEIIGSLVTESNPHKWMARGICRQPGIDPDLWHPKKGGSGRMARGLCRLCPVLSQCEQFVVETRPRYGIWAGMATPEIRKFIKEMR